MYVGHHYYPCPKQGEVPQLSFFFRQTLCLLAEECSFELATHIAMTLAGVERVHIATFGGAVVRGPALGTRA